MKNKDKNKIKSINLPESPGVYLMKDINNKIIYVGKAKNLKNRVSQYFRSDKNHTERIKSMVKNVKDFDYIITESEYEALVLECSLIKHYSPKYNILLKDDKGYYYIKITKEKWPRILFQGKKVDDGAEYIGPYLSSLPVKKAIESAIKIFKLPICKKDFDKRSRPCLNYYIGQCTAPCAGKISLESYLESIKESVSFLKTGSKETINRLSNEMDKASDNLEFEKAAKIRDKIKAIKNIKGEQKVVSNDKGNQDIIAIAELNRESCIGMFRFNDGKLYKSENFIIYYKDDLSSLRADFIKRFYTMYNDIPDKIIIDGKIEDDDLIAEWFLNKNNKKVKFVYPNLRKDLKLVQMCKDNAFEYMLRALDNFNENLILEELKNILSLDNIPKYIEAYDISNIQGDENVGGMVVFKDGKPFKSAYKKFKIKSINKQDDYASMSEVIRRRINEYNVSNKNKSESGFRKKPDLILVDGGIVHTKIIRKCLKDLNIKDIPVFGMVKDSKHKTKALTDDVSEIDIKSHNIIFKFVSSIQDEVHRFTIKYHRTRKNTNMLYSELNQIKGIGKKRSKELLKRFKSLDRISKASVGELILIPGITKSVAYSIVDFFNKKLKLQ